MTDRPASPDASFLALPVDDPIAHELLAHYFASRAETFPRAMGRYRTTFPTPEDFARGRGGFLVVRAAIDGAEPADVGCGGIRIIASPREGVVRVEVKHLWLEPIARGRGLGRALLAELERRAIGFGATELVLDTNDSLEAAGSLYRSSGFVEVEPYNDNPNATTWFMKRLG